MKILLVEDNERVSQFVVKGLQEAGHTTDHASTGRDGMFLAACEPYDVIIMDRMLPGEIDGLAIIEVLRKAGKRTPILILSALSEVDDRIRQHLVKRCTLAQNLLDLGDCPGCGQCGSSRLTPIVGLQPPRQLTR